MKGATAKVVYRDEYTPFPWSIEELRLTFDIDPELTTVHSTFAFSARDGLEPATELKLKAVALIM